MMDQKNRYKGAIGLLLAVGIGCSVWAGSYLYQQTAEKQRMEELREEVKESASSQEMEKEVQEEPEEQAEPYVDFQALKQRNPDIYAWITVPGTRIDYPVLQREGAHQDYYLMHDIEGNLTASGSIYTENLNKKDFTDPNTVIYGHNMKNGTMFRDLHLFQEKEFFDAHPDIYIDIPGSRLTYEIFSAYEYDNRHILKSFDFSDPSVYESYLDSALDPRSVNVMTREGISLTGEDRIITLSTCIGKDTSRYLVQAVLRKKEPVALGAHSSEPALD